jgi:hypothetical protein
LPPFENSQRLRREGFFLGEDQKPAGYIAIMLTGALGAIAGYIATMRHNSRVTAGLHQWQGGDIWLAYQPGQKLLLATTFQAWWMIMFAALLAGSFVWFVFLLCKPDQNFRQRFNFCAGALLSAAFFTGILYLPGIDTRITIDRTNGWVTGGSIPEGETMSFSQIESITTYPSPHGNSTVIGALTANGRIDLLTESSAEQAQKVGSLV